MDPQALLNAILLISVFLLVFSGWTICVLLWVVQYVRRRKRLQQRMGFGDEETRRAQTLQLWRDDYEARRGSAKRKKETLGDRLETLRLKAGWQTAAHIVILAVLGVAVLSCVVVVMVGQGWWLGLGVSVSVVVIFHVLTRRRISRRIALFETQFVDSLRIAARALRAGHPLVGAFQAIAEEIPDPVGPIFGDICQEQTLGVDLSESIRRVADRSHNADLKLFATAVSIQMTTGGNLAEVMESLAAVMRSRMRLSRRVRVLTASTRMSKNTLLGVPVFLFVVLNIMSPDYVGVLYTSLAGKIMLAVTVVSMLFGAWVMGKISELKY